MTISRRPEWGPWYYDPKFYVLWTTVGQGEGHRYEVGLEDCTSSAAILDWIAHIANKEWTVDRAARAALIAGLVTAIDDFLDLQANVCSMGRSKHLLPSAIRRLVDARNAR